MLRNFLCGDPLITTILVADVVLFVAAIGLMIWYFVRNRKSAPRKTNNKPISKLDDDTYVMDDAKMAEPEPEVVQEDNEVVHFVNQIANINEERNNEHSANAVVVNHEVEAPIKKMVAKDEIENFVEIAGEKKTRTEEEIDKSVNRGTNAFKNATNFLNTIKSEQSSEDLSSKKVSRKK